jgi:hypothetical protein
MGKKAHIISELPERDLKVVFSSVELELYMRQLDGNYIAREVVVGGSETKYNKYKREKVIVL